MRLKDCKWLVFLLALHCVRSAAMQTQFSDDSDYYYEDPEMDESISMNAEVQPRSKKYFFSALPRSAIIPLTDASMDGSTTTECDPDKPPTTTTECEKSASEASTPGSPAKPDATQEMGTTTAASPAGEAPATPGASPAPPAPGAGTGAVPLPVPTVTESTMHPTSGNTAEMNAKAKELHQLVQHLYIAQARVQLEASEIKKAQAVANSAQQSLEEAANHVRAVTSALQTAQQEVASAAIRAQTAQLQLAAHDQLLFAARQDVDALSSQMVGLQAAEGISQPKVTFDITGLLEKLRQPLPDGDKPTAVPAVCPLPHAPKEKELLDEVNDSYYYD